MKILNDTVEPIREINLAYIMLARQLLQEEGAAGANRLGLSKEVADILANLTLTQVIKFAASDHLLCSFRFNDHAMLSALTNTSNRVGSAPQHSGLLAAEQKAVQFA